MNSPGIILKLWNKAVKKQDEGKKPADLPRKGQEQKQKIGMELKKLKFQGLDAISNPSAQDTFVGTRDRTVTLMTKYCRYLKTARDEKVAPKYLKTMKQLTVVIAQLDPGSLGANEDETGMDVALEAVDTSTLDLALEQPETDSAETSPEAPPVDEAPAAPPAAVPDAAVWQQRRKAMEPALLAALKENRSDADKLRSVFAYAQGRAAQQPPDYVNALKGLDSLEKLLQSAPPQPNGTDLAGALSSWQSAHKLVVSKLRVLAKDLAQSGHPRAMQAVLELNSVIKNLTPNPTTKKQVAELDRYLTDDDVVADVCQLAFNFRADLNSALTDLKVKIAA